MQSWLGATICYWSRVTLPLDTGTIQKALQPLQGVVPTIALIGHQLLGNSQGNGFHFRAMIFHPTGHLRNVLEACSFREKATNFHLWVDAGIETTEQL